MSSSNLQADIDRFWNWFQESEHLFKEVTDPQAVVEAMDEHVLAFGLFSWEIGEGNSRPHYFMISPNGDGRRMEISYKIMKSAPDLRDWEFRYCKPPKDWDFQLEVYNRFLVKQLVDVSKWTYVIHKTPDNMIEVVIRSLNMIDIDTEDQLNAAEAALINILGEELVIDNLGALEVVEEFSIQDDVSSHHMRTLKSSFEKLVFSVLQ
ncbi:MAG: hypothetical protein AAFZ15_03880 [Bacteroidota bacterium]